MMHAVTSILVMLKNKSIFRKLQQEVTPANFGGTAFRKRHFLVVGNKFTVGHSDWLGAGGGALGASGGVMGGSGALTGAGGCKLGANHRLWL